MGQVLGTRCGAGDEAGGNRGAGGRARGAPGGGDPRGARAPDRTRRAARTSVERLMRRAWRVIQLVLLPSLGLVVALLIAPQRATLAIHVWLLIVLGLAFLAFLRLVQALYPRTPSPFEGSLRRQQPAAERPGSLSRLEREVSMAGSAAFDVHFRLRPVIAELADGAPVLAPRHRPRARSRPRARRARRRRLGARPPRSASADRASRLGDRRGDSSAAS